MDITLQAAVISGIVVLLSAIIGATVTYLQQRRDRFRWAEQLKQTYATEILRVRLEEYPKLGAMLMNLGRYYGRQLSAEQISKLARDINVWAYGRGGLCAEPDTRSAVFILRETLDRYAIKSEPFEKVREWRQLVINLLRRDLDLGPAYELPERDYQTLFAKLNSSLEDLRRKK